MVIGLGSLSLPLFSALFASLRFNGASVNCMDTAQWRPTGTDCSGPVNVGGFVLACSLIADQGGADHDAARRPPSGRSETCSCRNHMAAKVANTKLSAGQRPEEADVALGHQDQQAGKEQRLEENAQQDLRIGGAGFTTRDISATLTCCTSPICVDALLQAAPRRRPRRRAR